jgi:hypothetical protein
VAYGLWYLHGIGQEVKIVLLTQCIHRNSTACLRSLILVAQDLGHDPPFWCVNAQRYGGQRYLAQPLSGLELVPCVEGPEVHLSLLCVYACMRVCVEGVGWR